LLYQQIQLKEVAGTFGKECYLDEKSCVIYAFLTNVLDIPATASADLHKERWQIELFFKWMKQNLHINSFLGVSRNAVMTQI
jgi:putative transposase